MLPDLGLAVEWMADGALVQVGGEVDLTTRTVWEETLALVSDAGETGDGGQSVLDLSGLTFIDGRGAFALLEAAQRAHHAVVVAAPPPCLLRVVTLLWSEGLQGPLPFEIHGNVQSEEEHDDV